MEICKVEARSAKFNRGLMAGKVAPWVSTVYFLIDFISFMNFLWISYSVWNKQDWQVGGQQNAEKFALTRQVAFNRHQWA